MRSSPKFTLASPAPDNRLRWYDGTYVQYSNWLQGRPTVNDTFMAGLSLSGKWVLVSNEKSFSQFKQLAIVTCKLDNGRCGSTPPSWHGLSLFSHL